jgi:hypothetical protein
MDIQSCNNCSDTMTAAKNGHLECLIYAHENGCPWSVWTCANAAGNGHLDCLIYAHENGCPWDEFICTRAAENGHLYCLRYARENGCPWSIWACNGATRNGHLNCLKFLHENGCPCSHRKLKTYSINLDTVANDSSNECCVCLNNNKKVQFLPCNHMCCASCTNRLIKQNSTCPYCRREIKDTILIN